MSIADAPRNASGPTPSSNGASQYTVNAGFNEKHLRKFLSYIVDPATGATEACALTSQKNYNGYIVKSDFQSTLASWYDNVDSLVADAKNLRGTSLYVCLNPTTPDLLARSYNSIGKVKNRTNDDNIVCLRWFYIDVDPKRLDDTSSTDEQLGLAVAKRDQILADYPEIAKVSLIGKSGNGAFIMVRLPDYPNDKIHRELIADGIASLIAKYNDSNVTIDVKTKNAARLGCVPGTKKCKGSNIPDHPWRLATLDGVPDSVEPGQPQPTLDLKAWLERNPVPAPPAPPTPPPRKNSTGSNDREFRLKRAAAYVDKMPHAVAGERGHDATFSVACALVKGFDLTVGEAQPIIDGYNARCSPQWSSREIEHKLSQADKVTDDKARGYLFDAERPGYQQNGSASHSVKAAPALSGTKSPDTSKPAPPPIDVDALRKRAGELAGGPVEELYRDKAFHAELARLEKSDPGEAAAITAQFGRIEGFKSRAFDKAMKPIRDEVQGRNRKDSRAGSGDQKGQEDNGEQPIVGDVIPVAEYRHDDSMITMITPNPDSGEDETTILTNFFARITREVIKDDGSEELRRTFWIEGKSSRDQTPRLAEIKASDFEKMAWPTVNFGAQYTIYAGRGFREHVRAAVQSFSLEREEVTVFGHTGWRRLAGRWTYLHAGGGITETGNDQSIVVQLPGSLARYRLPDPPSGERLVKAAMASLDTLRLGQPERSGSTAAASALFAATFRSAIEYANYSIQVHGPSSTFKSSHWAIGQQHFGAGMDWDHLPASWATDTALSIWESAGLVHDSLFVADDFIPRGTAQEIARKHAELQGFYQAVGNHQGRNRLAQDGSPRPGKPPACSPVTTGEDQTYSGSADARTLSVRYRPGMIDKPMLEKFQAVGSSGLYAESMAGYIRWLAPRLDDIRTELRASVLKLRKDLFVEGDHGRTPQTLAHLVFGAKTFLRFAREIGAIDEAKEAEHLKSITAGLKEASGEMRTDRQEELAPADQFLNLLTVCLSRGTAYVSHKDTDSSPGGLETACGWKWVERPQRDAPWTGNWEVGPNARRIGWTDGKTVYLQAEAAYAVVYEVANESGQGFSLTQRTLGKRLLESGKLAITPDLGQGRGSRTRYTTRISIKCERMQKELLPIPVATLWPGSQNTDAEKIAADAATPVTDSAPSSQDDVEQADVEQDDVEQDDVEQDDVEQDDPPALVDGSDYPVDPPF